MDVKDEWKVAWHDSKQDGVRCQCVAKETKKKIQQTWIRLAICMTRTNKSPFNKLYR